jgi:hypothetical protein
MKTFKKYLDAEKYAMEISAKELRCISIVHLFREGLSRNDLKKIKRDFTVMDTKNEWYFGIDHVMLISNFETPFIVRSISPKSGEHINGFPTKELADVFYKKLVEEKYRNGIYRVNLTHEQYIEQWVTPFQRCKEISDEYRKTLIAK